MEKRESSTLLLEAWSKLPVVFRKARMRPSLGCTSFPPTRRRQELQQEEILAEIGRALTLTGPLSKRSPTSEFSNTGKKHIQEPRWCSSRLMKVS